MDIVTLLIWLIVVCFVIWAVYAIVTAFGIPDPWRTIIFVVVGLLILFAVLGGGSLRLPTLR